VSATAPIPPARCSACSRDGFWRYRSRARWHCLQCAPCPDADDAVFAFAGALVDAKGGDGRTLAPEDDAALRRHSARWKGQF
jgi:hypothetical protein